MTTPFVSVCYRPGEFVLPPRYVGKIPAGRLASTPGDNVVEFSAKTCYDTFLTNADGGRPSCDYHAHVLGMGHNSVAAHCVETFEVDTFDSSVCVMRVLTALAGRPGVWVTGVTRNTVRFALSLRAVLEWADHGVAADIGPATLYNPARLGYHVRYLLAPLFPLTLPNTVAVPTPARNGQDLDVHRVAPRLPQERWVSLYMEGVSRDLLQELSRHHYQTNPSVRSTRYVDEGASHQMLHPALVDTPLADVAAAHFANARTYYRYVYRSLVAKGVDKKTARGAARSLLPGATETRLVYSLSEFQAKHILALRADQSTGAVDPEIKHLAGLMRTVLRAEGWDV